MAWVMDDQGEREVTDDELAVLRQQADAAFDERMAALTWQPIAEYDKTARAVVLLRDRQDRWTLGYWGLPEPPDVDDPQPWLPADPAPFWRHAGDVDQGRPIAFHPSEFAQASDDWTAALMED